MLKSGCVIKEKKGFSQNRIKQYIQSYSLLKTAQFLNKSV